MTTTSLTKTLFDFIKDRAEVYDWAKPYRRQFGWKGPVYECLNKFSMNRGGKVNFLQIGAADGLRNDPIREFVVRDSWRGIFVEPLPAVFEKLKDNYAHINKDLKFLNAAVSSSETQLPLYTFGDEFLSSLSEVERLNALRKSSFSLEQVKKFLAKWHPGVDDIITVPVPCYTVGGIIREYGKWLGELDLLAIDAEGHEPAILGAIDFMATRPAGIFFESCNLGVTKQPMFDRLTQYGYVLHDCGSDTMALRA